MLTKRKKVLMRYAVEIYLFEVLFGKCWNCPKTRIMGLHMHSFLVKFNRISKWFLHQWSWHVIAQLPSYHHSLRKITYENIKAKSNYQQELAREPNPKSIIHFVFKHQRENIIHTSFTTSHQMAYLPLKIYNNRSFSNCGVNTKYWLTGCNVNTKPKVIYNMSNVRTFNGDQSKWCVNCNVLISLCWIYCRNWVRHRFENLKIEFFVLFCSMQRERNEKEVWKIFGSARGSSQSTYMPYFTCV